MLQEINSFTCCKILFLSWSCACLNLVFSITLFVQDFPSRYPCNLSILKDTMMWWMIYDIVTLLAISVSTQCYRIRDRTFYQNACLWFAFLYSFLLISGGIVLFKTTNDCSVTHPTALLFAVFLHWIYRMGLWLGFLLYGFSKRS